MANPRKFSEKIALLYQKQAEGTAEFNKVMKEVSDVTNKPPSLTCQDDQLKHSQQHSHAYRERSHNPVGVGPIRTHRPAEKRIDLSSPYPSYLSPPPNPWRRTHSDSSLHTSSHENNSHRKVVNECHLQNAEEYDPMKRSFSCTSEGRPRSAMDKPRVPGISIYPSQQDPGINQIPIGSNTGSLPDLSSFHMTSPLDIPLDSEESSYINSSHGGSARSLSPTQFMRNQRFTFGSSPNEAPGPPHQMNHVDRNPLHSTHSRPSPQMSPQLTIYKYDSQSPSSSPQSPPSPSSSVCKMNPSLDQNNYYISQDQVLPTLQHHFQQISMSEESCTKIQSHELPPDLIYCNPPSHQYSRLSQEPNANTPSSIPNITLTDFSNGEDFSKDYMADLFSSEECLREGLVPIDIDGLQMLTDPTLIADSATEDHLRHDGL